MKQNYIEIFENEGGNVTVKYAMPSSDQSLDIQTIELKHEDLSEIGHHFLYLAEQAEEA